MDRFFLRNFFGSVFSRKKTLIFLALLVLVFLILGACFVTSPAVYDYHLSICDGFLTDICFSDTNVFVIFLQRTGGCALLLLLILIGSIHPIALLLPIAVLIYRAFTCGGCLYVFFDYYGFTGGMIVCVLYLPIHLCLDAVLVFAATTAFARAFSFRFCANDFLDLLRDALILLLLVIAVCLVEMILLLALFHPIGKIL